jgi:ABC-type uncharacterized transport system substrate-binding protein
MAIVGDAVAFGLVSNVARPGGNLTGSTFFGPDIIAKRLELFEETLPNASLIAILINPANRAMPAVLKEMSTRARALGVKIRSEEVRKPSEFGEPDRTAVARGLRGQGRAQRGTPAEGVQRRERRVHELPEVGVRTMRFV